MRNVEPKPASTGVNMHHTHPAPIVVRPHGHFRARDRVVRDRSEFHRINLRIVAPLAILALLFAESGMAVPRVDEAPSVTVRYYDLNLDTPEDVASLYGRIRAAAIDVCKQSEAPQVVNRVFWSGWNGCVAQAIANAVKDVHNEKLSAYHWEQIRGWKRH
jgi:UrcA family protein